MLFADPTRSNKNKVSIFVPMLGKGKVSETDTNDGDEETVQQS